MIKLKNQSITLIIFIFFLGFTTVSYSQTDSKNELNGNIPIYNFESLEPLLYTNSDKIHIVNFWAMWCAPCVKELPFFQEYEKNNPKVELILVSLDFPEDIETKLKPFLKKHEITSKVVLLDDPDSNSWIDKIDPNWSGSIPFSIFFNNNKRSYYEGTFENVQDINNQINKTIHNENK